MTWSGTRAVAPPREQSVGFLPVNVERIGTALVIRASLPGYTLDEVSIGVEQNALTIDAPQDGRRRANDRNYMRRERFTRSPSSTTNRSASR
jgi:HSP20 family molecular chaperone IbpA